MEGVERFVMTKQVQEIRKGMLAEIMQTFHTLTGTLDSGGSGRTFVCLFKERFQQQSANTNK